ncbi:MAG: DNA polymerase III subunit beta [Planctomycetota bacterium]
MKVDFNRAVLQDALGLVTSIVPSRTPKPILRCLQMTAEADVVKLAATDLEVGIVYKVTQVDIKQQGRVVLPADRISAIIRESTDEVISVEASEATCHIRGADSHFTIFGHDSGQYPAVPDFDGKADIEVDLSGLQRGIEQCLFAVARESSRYAINGVLWIVEGKKLLLVGTDGRRLARSRIGLLVSPGKEIPANVIVPAKTVSLLDRLGGGEKEKVAVSFTGNQILFRCGNVMISSNLVEGNFPKYEDIIPTGYDKKLTLPTEQVLSAVRRAALLTNEDSKGIKIAIDDGALVITSRAPETGDAEIDMVIEYKGDPIEIGFNPQFLVDALRVVRSDTFDLELGQSDRPGVLKSGNDFLYVVMPINLG